jgi:hypothetical protein
VSEFGPFSPILPVPVDEAPSRIDSDVRDWGDVCDDVMEMVKLYNMIIDRLMAGSGELRSLGNLTEYLDQVEQRLGITWNGLAAGVYDPPQQRRTSYRVC